MATLEFGKVDPVGQVPPVDIRRRRISGTASDVESFYHLAGHPCAGDVCGGTACFVARRLNERRWAAAEKQTPRIYCLGRCFAGPAVAGDPTRPRVEVHARHAIVLRRLVTGGARSLSNYRRQGGYQALEGAWRRSPGDVLREVEDSELRGRGGAGFPVGRKWRLAAAQSASEKFIIANADEGDAGAYIDRFLMEDDPHALIEGLLLAAYVIGASQGWIYLRGEYVEAASIVITALAEAREAGLLGPNARGRGRAFDLELAIGHGSYVCGEETALIRSLEGRRPEVMVRPPYASEHGLFGRPTVMNNVETLVSVPWVVEHGGEAYRELGFSRSRGTKVVSLNSLFQRPGLYEVEFGVTVRHLVEELGGGLRDGAEIKGVLIGGPLAGIIPPSLFETSFGFEELRAIGASVGHGGVVAFDQHTSLAALMQHVFAFGAAESCGKCTPCRLGSRRVENIFAEILHEGSTSRSREGETTRLISALKSASLCGHGVGLAEFGESVRRHYGKEWAACFR